MAIAVCFSTPNRRDAVEDKCEALCGTSHFDATAGIIQNKSGSLLLVEAERLQIVRPSGVQVPDCCSQPDDEDLAGLSSGWCGGIQSFTQQAPHIFDGVEVRAAFRMQGENLNAMTTDAPERISGPKAPLIVHN